MEILSLSRAALSRLDRGYEAALRAVYYGKAGLDFHNYTLVARSLRDESHGGHGGHGGMF
jgi:hypothetical protein